MNAYFLNKGQISCAVTVLLLPESQIFSLVIALASLFRSWSVLSLHGSYVGKTNVLIN